MRTGVKFNLVGFPYNFKKLLKRDDFSGHINYSAPELILEKPFLTNKVDVWALGCTLFNMLHKKDPFDGRDPHEIKQNIIGFKLQETKRPNQNSEVIFVCKSLLQACLNYEAMLRPTCC